MENHEDGITAVSRELREELYLSASDITEDGYVMLGDYYYRKNHHRIYGANITAPIARFDRSELTKISWFPLASVQQIAREGNRHAGYEVDAAQAEIKLATSA